MVFCNSSKTNPSQPIYTLDELHIKKKGGFQKKKQNKKQDKGQQIIIIITQTMTKLTDNRR